MERSKTGYVHFDCNLCSLFLFNCVVILWKRLILSFPVLVCVKNFHEIKNLIDKMKKYFIIELCRKHKLVCYAEVEMGIIYNKMGALYFF